MSVALTRAAQLLTLSGDATPRAGAAQAELGILADATIVFDDDRITWIGSHDEFTAAHEAGRLPVDTIHDCAGMVIMPALVDSHTHLVWASRPARA